MARQILLTVGSFGLNVPDPLTLTTTPAGTITPSTATRAQLLLGLFVEVQDNVTSIELHNSGVCVNSVNVTVTPYGNDCSMLNPIANMLRGGYGLLYNWYVVDDARNITPAGWHIPTDAEWTTLSNALGGNTVSGGHLKEDGTFHWDIDNADNSSGFSARGAGYRRGQDGLFTGITGIIYMWGRVNTFGNNRFINSSQVNLQGNGTMISVKDGTSMRYIKDDAINPSTVTGNDGTIYRTVKIGSQVWTAENSRETKFRDGSNVPLIINTTEWAAMTSAGMCAYNNDWSNV